MRISVGIDACTITGGSLSRKLGEIPEKVGGSSGYTPSEESAEVKIWEEMVVGMGKKVFLNF